MTTACPMTGRDACNYCLGRKPEGSGLHGPALPGMGFRQRASSNFRSNIVSEPGTKEFVEDLVRLQAEAAADDFLLDLGGAAEDRLDAAEPAGLTILVRLQTGAPAGQGEASPGQREPRRSLGAIWAALPRHGIVSPRGISPSRGVAPTTTPNQRPRISQPSMRTSTPVSSSRHSSHRSSRCEMPATAARCGRAPARRRTAINTSAGVRTLITTAWAHATPDSHRQERGRALWSPRCVTTLRWWRGSRSPRPIPPAG
jgi:hypothetical protein